VCNLNVNQSVIHLIVWGKRNVVYGVFLKKVNIPVITTTFPTLVSFVLKLRQNTRSLWIIFCGIEDICTCEYAWRYSPEFIWTRM